MSKRAYGKFQRRKQDAYDTPPEAVKPLLRHLPGEFSYVEPCAGSGALLDALPGFCGAAWDIVPRDERVKKFDAMSPYWVGTFSDYIITNPPWTRQILHPMIERFSKIAPTWLLFDADWMHTKQAAPYRHLCAKVVSVGRVSWMQNGTSGLDNCAWYLFDEKHQGATAFHWRDAA